MKTVFTSAELPHVWIHEKAPHGRSPSAMSFHGNEYRSYSATIAAFHYCHGHTAGQKVVLLNSRRYSNTTTGHQSAVRRACSHLPTFSAPTSSINSPVFFVRACLDLSEEKFTEAAATERDFPRRKKVIMEGYAEALSLFDTAQKVAALFGLESELPKTIVAGATRDDLKARIAAAIEEKRKKKEAAAKEALRKWLAGEPVITTSLPEGKVFFRTLDKNVFGEPRILESSKGVRMSIEEARRGLAFILSKQKSGWTMGEGESFPIAGYRINSITKDGIIAGCHRFDWQEVKRVRAMLANLESSCQS